MDENLDSEKIKQAVRQAYGDIARLHTGDDRQQGAEGKRRPSQSTGCCSPSQPSSCCGPSQPTDCCGSTEATAQDSGLAAGLYSDEELSGLPDTVTGASLGCGNPLAIAELQPGEVVLDLGSGGGIDCFLASRQVGPEGRVIGLDMTPDMIKLARRNARKIGVTNVDFRYGEMEEMPLADTSVDVVISNCVINLSPDKDAVFAEAYRVLRPGGRLSVSDMVVDGDLPAAIRGQLDAWAGCIAGALDETVYLDKIRAAGFEDVVVVSRDYADLDGVAGDAGAQILVARPDGSVVRGEDAKALLSEAGLSMQNLAARVASIKVRARKPG